MEVEQPDECEIIDDVLLDTWAVEEKIDSGNNGVVYQAHHGADEVDLNAACKLMPLDDLKEGWEKEVKKASLLDDHPRVVSIKDYGKVQYDSIEYACIISEFVNGASLQHYIEDERDQITISFICSVAEAILDVLHGMEKRGISHNDLHTGNILLSESDITIDTESQIRITDFGIGGSHNSMQPKNDYVQLGDIILDLLEVIDRQELDNFDALRYEYLIDEFVTKYIVEDDPTKGEFVRSPRELQAKLQQNKAKAKERMEGEPSVKLDSPFEYLSCEQMGDSFNLIIVTDKDN